MTEKKDLTIEVLINHFEKLIVECEKLPLSMELHVKRNQYFSGLVKELKEKYDLVRKVEVENGEDKGK